MWVHCCGGRACARVCFCVSVQLGRLLYRIRTTDSALVLGYMLWPHALTQAQQYVAYAELCTLRPLVLHPSRLAPDPPLAPPGASHHALAEVAVGAGGTRLHAVTQAQQYVACAKLCTLRPLISPLAPSPLAPLWPLLLPLTVRLERSPLGLVAWAYTMIASSLYFPVASVSQTGVASEAGTV